MALLLVHDILISSKGIAAPKNHPLRAGVEKHKARLAAELTRIRVRRKCATLEKLGVLLEAEGRNDGDRRQVRWVRVNTLRTTVEEQLRTTFKGYTIVKSLDALHAAEAQALCIDAHIPNLLALPPSADLTKSNAYLDGLIILQDKASCFPAYLLDHQAQDGNIVDACAAPGNKTTHLAAIAYARSTNSTSPKIYACERDRERAKILIKMVEKAGAKDVVKVVAGQDFLNVSPQKAPWDKVTSLLLDPSCSGSGIVGRDEVVKVTLPRRVGKQESRKKERNGVKKDHESHVSPVVVQTTPVDPPTIKDLAQRLEALSQLQLRLLLHAMSFPKAKKIVYSTCSLYSEENEQVVYKALSSHVAKQKGWRISRREEQVDGLMRWPVRGDVDACKEFSMNMGALPAENVAEACIRCEKGTDEGTQGFFVAGFVRDAATTAISASNNENNGDDNEWNGFDD